jgi:hypothetical protein
MRGDEIDGGMIGEIRSFLQADRQESSFILNALGAVQSHRPDKRPEK